MTSAGTKKNIKTGKSGIIGKRTINGKPFFSNMRNFNSKEVARAVVIYLKKQDKSIKVRSVLKKNGVYLYYDELSFEKIKNSFLKEPTIDEIKELKITPTKKTTQSEKTISSKKTTPSKNSINKTPTIDRKHDQKSKKNVGRHSKPPKSQQKQQGKRQNKKDQRNKENKENDNSNNIFHKSHNFPNYLLSRLSKESRGYLRIGLLEIEKAPKKKLYKIVEKLRADQILFDLSFDKEKPIVDFMNDLSNLVNNRIVRYEEEEADKFIQKFIRDPMGTGKFDKILKKMEKKGLDEVSYLIFKTIKGKAKKFPRSESILIRNIKKAIKEKIQLDS